MQNLNDPHFSCVPNHSLLTHSFVPLPLSPHSMTAFPPQLKHHILQQYQPHSHSHSFSSLARAYGVKGGGSTIQKWYHQWNGSVASLQRKAGSGRPRALSKRQVNNYIRAAIKKKRDNHQAVHYSSILPLVQQQTGKQISLRTIQRYGKRDVQAKLKRSVKRTPNECK